MKGEGQKLTERKCEACTEETPVLKGVELLRYCERLDESWELTEEHHLKKSYHFKNFRKALDFTGEIGEMSEEEDHHPEIILTWGQVTVTIFTHVINGLSENDFIWAAKADALYEEAKE